MNSDEINYILKKFPLSESHFKGVYPSDQLPNPKKIKKLSCYVINTDPSTKSGSHWIGVILNSSKKKKCNIYFDSYGHKPFVKSIQEFVGKNFIHNKQQLQHPLSTTCGEWCIFFILMYLCKHNLHCINDFFKNSPDLLLNDYAVNKFVNQLSGKRKKVVNLKFIKNQIAKQMKENLSK